MLYPIAAPNLFQGNMKRFLLITSVLIWHVSLAGEPSKYRASIELHSKDVPAFMWQLNQNLELGITPELLSDSAQALTHSKEFLKEIQIHAEGALGLVTYRIAKAKRGVVVLSFSSGAWSIVPICEQMLAFSESNESAHPPRNCATESLELFET